MSDSPSRWGERLVPFGFPAAQVVPATAFVMAVKDEPALNASADHISVRYEPRGAPWPADDPQAMTDREVVEMTDMAFMASVRKPRGPCEVNRISGLQHGHDVCPVQRGVLDPSAPNRHTERSHRDTWGLWSMEVSVSHRHNGAMTKTSQRHVLEGLVAEGLLD